MILNDYEEMLLKHAARLEITTITSILANKNKYPETSVAKFENGLHVLTSALQRIDDCLVVEFDDEESYHLRYAIALRLRALMDGLLSDELMTDEHYDMFESEVNTLLKLYKILQ
ncbi:MAG: hypothetical protein E7260_11745 [Lachnospiraceae bacterium]|nr:hypothetical protein [Lachnospiraceae bacterium]